MIERPSRFLFDHFFEFCYIDTVFRMYSGVIKMRILHMAPFNYAGVPMTFVQAERNLGHESRLITFGRTTQNRTEDICLNLPFLDFWATRLVKSLVTPVARRKVSYTAQVPETIPLQWRPGTWVEKTLFRFREWIWGRKIAEAIQTYDLENFDVYQLDGGLEFYRDGKWIRKLKSKGKKIVCCYTGSDLRTRGVIPEIDKLSDINLTVEFDHLQYHPNIHHVPFPIFVSQFKRMEKSKAVPIRVGHAPTHRAAKGSNVIISVVRKLEKEFPVQLVLIEGLSYQKAIALKHTCHIFIDQIGNLGYGMNSVEALAMGIPTCSSLAPGFTEAYPDHPFEEITAENIEGVLIRLIQNEKLRQERGEYGQYWVRKVHEATNVVKKIHSLIGLSQI